MRRIEGIFSLLVIWGLASSPVWAASPQRDVVLGADGEIYIAKEGTYGELFPGGKAVDSANPVLALELTKPDGSQERLLVEGTEGPDRDRLPFLLYEESSRTVFLLWETRLNEVHPILVLSGYNGSWIDPVEIVGNPFAPKTSPQFTITRDTLQEPESGSLITRHRTVLHLAWGEERPNGATEAFYAPVIFDDGVLIGRSAIFKLADFDTSDAASAQLSPSLGDTLAIGRGRDERTAVVAFPSPRSQRLVTMEIDVLPAQLGRLAEEARMHIVDLGAKHSYPAGFRKVADLARMHIIDLGAKGFQSKVVESMAQSVSDIIAENRGAEKIEVLADRARMHIIDLGAKLSDRGLRTSASASTDQIQEITGQSFLNANDPARPSFQFLNFRSVASWPAPEVGNEAVRYFPAKSGKALLIAWPGDGKVLYRETQEDGWSRIKEIALSPALDLDRAHQILEDRMSRN